MTQKLPLLFTAAMLMLGACSPTTTAFPRPSVVRPSAETRDGIVSGPNLYVSNFGNNTITVYGLNRGKLLATIHKNLDDPVALAFSTQGQRWVGNSQPARQGRNWFRQGSISVYDPGSQTPIKDPSQNLGSAGLRL